VTPGPRSLGLWIAFALLSGCGGDPSSGPGDVTWDRDTCERCQMAISDRSFAFQVRAADGRLHRFDDPGCGVLWLGEHGHDAPRELWVRAIDEDAWLDAEQARYVEVNQTPMEYGFGARRGGAEAGIDFEALRDAVALREHERRKRRP
jgi:hypothetical protein